MVIVQAHLNVIVIQDGQEATAMFVSLCIQLNTMEITFAALQ